MSQLTPQPVSADYGDLRDRLEVAVRRICPAWLRDQQDDIVQAALLKLMQRKKSEGNEPLNTSFLYKVAHSVLVDEIRRHRRRGEVDLDPTMPDPVDHGIMGNPEGRARGRQVGVEILKCLETLKTSRRRAVTLYLQGHTVPQTADLLEITPKQAENLVYRGLSDLREALRKRGVAP